MTHNLIDDRGHVFALLIRIVPKLNAYRLGVMCEFNEQRVDFGRGGGTSGTEYRRMLQTTCSIYTQWSTGNFSPFERVNNSFISLCD